MSSFSKQFKASKDELKKKRKSRHQRSVIRHPINHAEHRAHIISDSFYKQREKGRQEAYARIHHLPVYYISDKAVYKHVQATLPTWKKIMYLIIICIVLSLIAWGTLTS